MADFNTLLTTYQSLVDKAGKERDPDHRKWLEQEASAHFALLQRIPDQERGDDSSIPKPAEGKVTVQPGVTSLPPSELERVRQVAESQAAPNAGAEFAPNAAHGASAQPDGGGMDRGLLDVQAQYRPKVAGVTPDVAAEVQPTAAPQPGGSVPGLTFEEFAALSRGGGRGGRVDVRGAAANADLAGVNADAASALERDAILKRGAQQESDGRQLGETMAQFAQSLKAKDEEHQAYLMQARERIGGLINESKVAAEEFRAATREQGFMQSLSSGGRVGAAISLALGALGGGLTGQGGNAALDVLKFRVDEDLRNRALNIQAKGQALDAVDGLLQRNMQIFGDEISAKEATRAAIFDSLKLEVQRQAAISGGVDAMNASKQLVAGMDAEYARSQEVLANRQYQEMLKAARSGGKNLAQLYKEYLDVQGSELKNMKAAADLSPTQGEPDIYSEEGKRAADRTARLYDKLKPIDATIEQGKLLLEKVGVPRVDTRARAGIDEFFTSSDSLVTKAVGLTALPARILSDEENAQMAAMLSFTNSAQKAVDSRVSNQDFNNARDLLIRQGPLIGQDALVKVVRQMVEQAEIMRKDALASDKQAAAAYEQEQAKRRGELPKQTGIGIPDYGRKF